MMTRYETVADTRPRIRRDVLFTKTPSGVLFHNAGGGFQLRMAGAYQFASLLVPYLNGEFLVADICADLSEKQREVVGELVGELLDRGFARDQPAEQADLGELAPEVAARFDAQVNYIDHYVDNARARFATFRRTPVAILGEGPVARWCALSLVRNGSSHVGVVGGGRGSTALDQVVAEAEQLTAGGCQTTVTPLEDGVVSDWGRLDGYEVVVCTGEGAERQMLALLDAGVPAGRIVLPAWRHGRHAVVGPMVRSGLQPCWTCAALRLGSNADPSGAADLWASVSLGWDRHAGPQASRQLSAMLGNLLGYEIFRLTTGVLPAETENSVIIQDAESMDVFTERLLPHPRCPHCGGDSAKPESETALDRGVDLVLGSITGPDDADDADGLLERLKERSAALVAPNVGVFTAFDDDTFTQSPLKVSRVRFGTGHAGRRAITAFDLHNVVGARLRALRRAAEAYAEHVGGLAAPTLATEAVEATGVPRLSLSSLVTASGTVTGPEHLVRWTLASSLTDGRRVALPTAAVYPFGTANAELGCVPSAAGAAAAESAAEATALGLLSALAYHALSRAVRGAVIPTSVRLESLHDDPELHFLLRSCLHLGISPELLDLAEQGRAGVPVVLARDVGDTAEPRFAVAGHYSWQQAAVTALRDLLGQAQLRREPDDTGHDLDTGDPLMSAFEPSTLVADGERDAPLAEVTRADTVRERMREAGLEAFVAVTTTPDLDAAGYSTVRVVLARTN